MSLIKVNKNENPYHIIGEYIEKHITYVDDIIAVISLDGNIINELFLVEITTESNFIWQNDWWEGEENVELIDFFFVSDACKRYDNNDLISRQAAIDVVDSETVSTNPEHFKSSEKFIKFMNNVDIASFGKWQWANGFNTALVVARIQLEKLPFAQLEIVRCKDCKHWIPYDWMFSEVWQNKNMADYPEDEIGCNWCDMAMKANDFCSRGERRWR